MTYNITTYKCGDNERYWTYVVQVDYVQIPNPPLIYRMWDKEQTAMRNGVKLLMKHFAKINSKPKSKNK